MEIEDIPGLHPRARKALLGLSVNRRPVQTVEDLEELGWKEVSLTRGVGESTLEVLRAAGFNEDGFKHDPATAVGMRERSTQAFGEAEKAQQAVQVEVYRQMASPQREVRALHILDKMAEREAVSPRLIALAWESAMAFGQEALRHQGVELTLHDDLPVSLHGQSYRIRTRVKAGEEAPKGSRMVLLVPER